MVGRFLEWLRSSFETQPHKVERLSAKDAFGLSSVGQTLRGMRSLPALAILVALFASASYVFAKVGVIPVLVLVWVGIGGVLFYLRDRLKMSNIAEALKIPPQLSADEESRPADSAKEPS